MTTAEAELKVVELLNHRVNLIIPNVSWGFFGRYEVDLLCITKAGYLWEIEIKISRADLIRDKDKRHQHYHDKIKRLYFAIPKELQVYTEHIPDRAGIISIGTEKCEIVRKAKDNNNYKISDSDRLKLAHLGAMRIWKLKRKLIEKSQLKFIDVIIKDVEGKNEE